MIMYAVKKKGENLFLPFMKTSNSKAEPTDPMEQSPRLFKSYRAASQAMRAWARGVHMGEGQWEGPDDPYSSGGAYFVLERMTIIPQRHRRLVDMEVVEIRMDIRSISHD